MTDVTAIPAPTPEPDPVGDRLARREANLQTLSRQPTPYAPTGAAAVLTDRFLLHTSWSTGSRLRATLPDAIGGFVLRGAEAGAGVRQLRSDGFDRPLIVDPEGYCRGLATEDEPFVVDPAEEETLFPLTLEDVLQGQRQCGATVALTPTGYLRAGDSDALRSAVRAAARIERDDVMFSVPLDVAWLTDEHIAHLIAVLAGLPMPKAVFIGGQFDPMKRYRQAVTNLRRVVAEAGHVAVFRTDLTGFDAMSHGAFTASIGTGGSLRHTIPYGERRRARKKDPSPSVLFGDLQSFHKGSTLAERFANARPPVCACCACDGRAIDTFVALEDQLPAHQHTMCTWASWIPDLLAQPTLGDRAAWWRNRCAAAVAHAEILSAQIKQPEAFSAPTSLRAWSDLPAWLSATTAANRNSSRR